MTDLAIQIFETTIKRHAQRHNEYTTGFAEKVTDSGLLYALEWAQDSAVTVAQAELWATVEQRYRDNDIDRAHAVESVLSEVTKRLLNNWVVSSSTSQFTNATSYAKAEGYSRFHEEATALLAQFTKNDN